MKYIIALFVVVLFLASCSERQSVKDTQPDLQHIYITVTSDNGFIPDKVIMKKGVILDIYSYDESFSLKNDALGLSEMIPVKEIKSIILLPEATGDYRFYCDSCSTGNKEILVTIN